MYYVTRFTDRGIKDARDVVTTTTIDHALILSERLSGQVQKGTEGIKHIFCVWSVQKGDFGPTTKVHAVAVDGRAKWVTRCYVEGLRDDLKVLCSGCPKCSRHQSYKEEGTDRG